MALANYADLIAAAPNWLGRADLTARIPEGIALAEAKMNRKLRTKDMVTKNAAFSITGEYVAVPAGFGGVKMWHLNDTPRSVVTPMSEDLMTANYGDGTTGAPVHFCVQGSNFRIQPTPSTATSSTLVYYLQVPALTVSATTNWLMTSHPDAYLYGVNAEMCALAKDWQAAQTWEQRMYAILDEIVSISRRDVSASGSMAARPG